MNRTNSKLSVLKVDISMVEKMKIKFSIVKIRMETKAAKANKINRANNEKFRSF